MAHFNHHSGHHLNRGDASIYYEVVGKQLAPVLLLLHGGFGNMEDFNEILPELSEQFTVIGIDSRGQGKSTLGSTPFSYALLQQDVEAVLAHLRIDTLSILGFSDGGVIAYRLAALTSLTLQKLVTIGARWHEKNIAYMKNIFQNFTGADVQKRYPAFYEAYQKLNPTPDFDRLTAAILNMWFDHSAEGCPGERVKNINCPTLIIRGENDPVISSTDLMELAMLISDAKTINIPAAGHFVPKDQKTRFMQELLDFV